MVDLKSKESILIRNRKGHSCTEKKAIENEGTDRSYVATSPRNTWSHQKLEEARKDSSLEPSEGAWPCRHLDFGLLVSRTTNEYISVILHHPICGIWLWQP